MGSNTYNILALDGGGLRGVITSMLLDRISREDPYFLNNVDLVVGTSTGGILALALAKGLPPVTITDMYLKNGAAIFRRGFWRTAVSLLGLRRAKYDNTALKEVLHGVFGESRLSDLSKKVAIPTFKLDDGDPKRRSWSPKIFHNFLGSDSDGRQRTVDVALYTSAAPSYFPSVDGYVDGGVVANNPSLVGLAQALDRRSIPLNSTSTVPRQIDDIRLLSVGTGTRSAFITGDRHDWGIMEWASPLLDILFDGVSEISDFQCRQLLRHNYYRLQVDFPRGVDIAMDDASNLDLMVNIAAAQSIQPVHNWLTCVGW